MAWDEGRKPAQTFVSEHSPSVAVKLSAWQKDKGPGHMLDLTDNL